MKNTGTLVFRSLRPNSCSSLRMLMFVKYEECSPDHTNWTRRNYNVTRSELLSMKYISLSLMYFVPTWHWRKLPSRHNSTSCIRNHSRKATSTSSSSCCFSGDKNGLLQGVILQHNSGRSFIAHFWIICLSVWAAEATSGMSPVPE